jgi:predicted secreted protein
VKHDGADARTIAIVTAENPQPLNGFVRLSGARGFLSTRLRIRQSSLVSAYVRTSDGLYMTSQRIKIGYGGYGMLHEEPRPAVDTDTPLHVVTRMRVRRQDGHSEVLVLVNHPMGMSGGVPAGSGAAQPAHLIELMAIERNGRTVAEIHMGPGIAPNPLTGILLDITRIGDRISARWVDSEGLSGGAEQRIT